MLRCTFDNQDDFLQIDALELGEREMPTLSDDNIWV